MLKSFRFTALGFLLLAFIAACDSSSGPTGKGSGKGEGSLTLAGVTYDFDVIVCDFTGEVDNLYQTVYGKGTTPAGKSFEVFVSRNQIEDFLIHNVSYQTGDVRSGAGTVIEAIRMKSNGIWTSLFDDPNEPLVKISGNTLTATGTFYVSDDIDETFQGHLVASCR